MNAAARGGQCLQALDNVYKEKGVLLLVSLPILFPVSLPISK